MCVSSWASPHVLRRQEILPSCTSSPGVRSPNTCENFQSSSAVAWPLGACEPCAAAGLATPPSISIVTGLYPTQENSPFVRSGCSWSFVLRCVQEHRRGVSRRATPFVASAPRQCPSP
jgi:hypothetical protein